MESSMLCVIGRRPPEEESKIALRFYTSGGLTTLLFQLKTEVIHRSGRILDGHCSLFSPSLSCPRKTLAFSYYPPLGNLLAVCGRLEHDLYTGAHWDLVHRSSREVGVHLDTRVLVQHNHRDVERLIPLKQPDRAVVHHPVVVDLAPPTELLPFQVVP